MATYRNLQELGSNVLKKEDIIYFTIIKYRVCDNFLMYEGGVTGKDNDEIFNYLSLDKYDFCTKHYGYKTNSGIWPASKEDDYPALTRVVKALFEIIEKDSKSEFKVGDLVYIIPYGECKEKGIDTMSLSPDWYGTTGIVQGNTELGNVRVKIQDHTFNYSTKALKPIKDYEVKLTASPDSLETALSQFNPYLRLATYQLKTHEEGVEFKSTKIKISPEFKFIVNKPKKVFF